MIIKTRFLAGHSVKFNDFKRDLCNNKGNANLKYFFFFSRFVQFSQVLTLLPRFNFFPQGLDPSSQNLNPSSRRFISSLQDLKPSSESLHHKSESLNPSEVYFVLSKLECFLLGLIPSYQCSNLFFWFWIISTNIWMLPPKLIIFSL